MAAEGARVVGYGSFWPVRDDRFRMDLAVAAEHRRRGIGARLLGVLTGAAQAAGAATLQARTESERLQVLAFLSRQGFAESMRMHRLVLDVADATLGPYAGVEPRLAAEGITPTTLEDEQHRIGGASWHRLCLAYHAAAREHGPARLYSTTGNPAMLKVNQRLGYLITSTEVRLVRRLQQPGVPMPDNDTLR